MEQQTFDAYGRRVVVGRARRAGSGVELSLWCEGDRRDECIWAIEEAWMPSPRVLVTNPARTEALVGDDERLFRIDLRSGTVLPDQLCLGLHPIAWVSDGTVIGRDHGLVRRTVQGEPRPVWANRSVLIGLIERPLERWLMRSHLDLDASRILDVESRPLQPPGRCLVDSDEAVHLVGQGTLPTEVDEHARAICWVRFDRRGAVVHRLAVRVHEVGDDAIVSASGHLWVSARLTPQGRWAIIRIDPDAGIAQPMAEAEDSRPLKGFALDPQGRLHLREGEPRVGMPWSAPIEVIATRSRARMVLPIVTLAHLGTIAASLSRRETLLQHAARGETYYTEGARGIPAWYDPQELLVIADAVAAQAVLTGVAAAGLLLLTRLARQTLARAACLGVVWLIAVAVLAMVVYHVIVLDWFAGNRVVTASPLPFYVAMFSMGALGILAAVKAS